MGPQPPPDDTDAAAPQDEPSALDDLLKRVAQAPDLTPEFFPNVAAGPSVGRFELIRPLGQGGFGVVFQARDTELGRHVAVKLVRPDRLARRGAVDRAWLLDIFHREAEAAAKLNHPNIITIYDYGTHEGAPYLVLELLLGETLSRRLERGPLPTEEAVSVLVQICRGLAHAHAAGVIHRDLKPGNVFLREDGQVKILDFGLAHVAEALSGTGRESLAAGTPAYMAPEQWRGQADQRTDVFACGIILFEMLCGRSLFDGSARERGDREARLGLRMAGIPPDLVAITERALATDPGDRNPSAHELAEALLRLAEREHDVVPTAQPYRYLEQFTEGDAPWFFGREREVVRLEQMLAARPLVALVGPSGAGKSSLVHAGLVPRLRRERTVVAMRPGSEPLQRLYERLVEVCGEERVTRLLPDAEHLVTAPGRAGRLLRAHARDASTPIVLVVDQLEELVTQVQATAVRRAFAEALLSMADDAAGPIRVVVTLRGDFLGRLTKNAELRDALARNMVLLGPPDADALAETLRRPAARLGYDYETGLVEEMVAAVADEAAPLPLLQLAASRLWERRDTARRLLTRAGLAAAGGVAGILAAHANEVLDGVTGPEEVAAARRMLCDLVTDQGTRYRARREDLLARFEDPLAAGRVLERLVSGRLVTSYRAERGEWVELAHESLIAGWTLLQSWLDEDRADRQFRERLLAAAALWQERRRPEELLWRGDTLDEALRWRRRYQGPLGVAEGEFLSRSEAQLVRARRMRRRLFAGAAALAIAISVGSLVGVRAYREAAREARLRALVKTAAASPDPLLGALLLAELQGQPEPPGGAAGAALVAAQPIPLAVLRGHEDSVMGLAFSPDGKLMATTGRDGTARIWRADGTGTPIVLRGHGTGTPPELGGFKKIVGGIEFSPDGGRVLTAGGDGTARIWRTDGTEPVVLRHRHLVRQARFTPDGTAVVTVCAGEAARRWRADGRGEPIVFPHPASADNTFLGLEPLSPDGKLVVTVGDDGARIWHSDGSGEPVLLRGRGRAVTATFSPDSAWVLVRYAGEARIWQADGQGVPVVLPVVEPATVGASGRTSEAFSPDGKRVAVWAEDRIRIYSADGKGEPVEIPGRFYLRVTIAFSPDGTRLLTATERQVQLWPTDGRGPPDVLRGGPGFTTTRAVFSREGSRILTAHQDGLARVWAVGERPGVRVFRGHRGPIWAAEVSPDGQLLATASIDGTARLWPLDGGGPLVLAPGAGGVYSATFTPDGAKVVVSAEDGLLRVWPRTGGEPLVLPAGGYPDRAVLSTDGAWIATVSRDGEPTLVRTDGSGEPVRLRRPEMVGVRSLSFSPDGSRVAAAWRGGAWIWRTDRPDEAEVVLPANDSAQAVFHPNGTMLVTAPLRYLPELRFWSADGRELRSFNRLGGPSVAWSPDGERLATGLMDGAVRVERLDRRGEPIILNGHESSVESVSFAPDGRLATASADATARLWLVDWAGLVAALRSATTACLTPGERTNYLGETPAEADAAWASCERRFGRAP